MVNATPVTNSDGTTVTQFNSYIETTQVTYTYATDQDCLMVWNKGYKNLTLNVGTFTSQTILPGQTWKNDVGFTTFNIKTVSGASEILVSAIQYANKSVLKGTTAQRPNATIGQDYFDSTLGKPVWKKNATQWVDATGTVV